MCAAISKCYAGLAAALLFAAVGQAKGEILVDYNTTIDYTTMEDVHVVDGANPPTVLDVVHPAWLSGHTSTFDSSILNVTGGTARHLYAYDSSAINSTGGGWCSVLETYDTSTATLVGGFNDLFAYGSSTVDVIDAVGEIWSANGSSTITIQTGESDFLQANDSSEVNVYGGSFFWPSARDSSKMNIYGGTIALFARNAATASVSGGTIIGLWSGDLWPGEDPGMHTCVITVEGSGFNYPDGPIPDAAGTLTGALTDGSAINAPFEIHGGASIILVPEPATLLLLSVAAVTVVLRRRRAT